MAKRSNTNNPNWNVINCRNLIAAISLMHIQLDVEKWYKDNNWDSNLGLDTEEKKILHRLKFK